MNRLTIGSRISTLAMWQTNHIIDLLRRAFPELDCKTEPFVTKGDKTLDQPLPAIGGKGLFTSELEDALRSGRIDIAVHSLKDLPVENGEGLTLGAIVGRADVRDLLIGHHRLANLPLGAIVGTSSLRRQAQLRRLRPDLDVRSIRGNVQTRIRKVQEGQYDATILAAAGVIRLELEEYIAEWLSLDIMLPAPGQGALAVQCRADDAETLALLSKINCAAVETAVFAERTFLNHLNGGCATPVGAYALMKGDKLHLTALVAAADGSRQIKVEGTRNDNNGRALGIQLAKEALAQGAGEILGL